MGAFSGHCDISRCLVDSSSMISGCCRLQPGPGAVPHPAGAAPPRRGARGHPARQVSSDWWRAGHVTSVPPPIGQDPAQLRDGEPALPGPHLEAGPRPAGAEARQAVQGRPGRAAEEVRNIRNNSYENRNNEYLASCYGEFHFAC